MARRSTWSPGRPDHARTFTAQVRVGDQLFGNGFGRTKNRRSRRLHRLPSSRFSGPFPPMPEPPEVEVVRRGPRSLDHRPRHRRRRGAPSLAVRRHAGPPTDLRPSCVERIFRGAPQRQVPVVADGRCRAGRSPGDVRAVPGGRRTGEHTRIRFRHRCPLLFDDQRTFGGMWPNRWSTACRCRCNTSPSTRSIHYDRRAVKIIRGRRAPVKAFKLDQGIVSGIGNIYADEALCRFASMADPGAALSARKVGELLMRPRRSRWPAR